MSTTQTPPLTAAAKIMIQHCTLVVATITASLSLSLPFPGQTNGRTQKNRILSCQLGSSIIFFDTQIWESKSAHSWNGPGGGRRTSVRNPPFSNGLKYLPPLFSSLPQNNPPPSSSSSSLFSLFLSCGRKGHSECAARAVPEMRQHSQGDPEGREEGKRGLEVRRPRERNS